MPFDVPFSLLLRNTLGDVHDFCYASPTETEETKQTLICVLSIPELDVLVELMSPPPHAPPLQGGFATDRSKVMVIEFFVLCITVWSVATVLTEAMLVVSRIVITTFTLGKNALFWHAYVLHYHLVGEERAFLHEYAFCYLFT